MIEEIKDDNNCIMKAFENNPISILYESIDNKKVYFFKASDIGQVLNIVNIRTSIVNFDDDEKVVRTTYSSSGGNPDTIYLTSQGVYRLLYNSKKEVAKKFRKWVGNILDDIIFNNSNELKKQLEEQKQLLIEHKEQTEQEKEALIEQTLLSQFCINTQCVYYGKIDNTDTVGGKLIKFGMSNNLPERVKAHKKTYTNFRLVNAFKVSNQIEIENCIKKHPLLKKRIRNIMIEDMNYRELICIDPSKKDPEFTLQKLEEYIKQIIEENQYNIENYKKLLEKNMVLEKELKKSNDKIQTLTDLNNKIQSELDKYTPNTEQNRITKSETTGGYSLFAFECSDLRFKVGMCKTSSLESRDKMYKASNPNCEMKLHIKIKHPFIEKIMLYLLKRHLTFLNNDTFDGSLADIKYILEISSKVEELFINNDLQNIYKILNGESLSQEEIHNDPEVPFIRKAKRSIDQIDKDTGKVLGTFPSIEAAGRFISCSGAAIGIALRNVSVCQGYLWRYTGISKEDQMQDQKVNRINCKTGEITNYPNIASAARSAKISPPGLRNRILTDCHVNGFHWVFDKTSSHYK